jgi:hypothetical protein
MVNSPPTPEQGSKRFDDVVRSERFFTATLLPGILFHNNLQGVRHFVQLIDEKAKKEHNARGDQVAKGTRNYNNFDDVQIITEFHIARDLSYAGLRLSPAGVRAEEDDKERRDAPDIVIIAGQELVICEGKFFSDFNSTTLKAQLLSQRRQIAHLFLNRQEMRAYRHVALLSEKVDESEIEADAIVTWPDICGLAQELMGPDHYVTIRLREAVKRYRLDGDPNIRNYDGVLPFDKMRDECRASGDKIEVGHWGGEKDLITRDLVYAEKKPWKWRDPAVNKGAAIQANWLPGNRWLEIVESRHGFKGR